MQDGTHKSGRGSLAVVLVLPIVLAAGVLFTLRGPVRAMERSNDYRVIYAASRAWWTGRSPYGFDSLLRVLRDAGWPGNVQPGDGLVVDKPPGDKLPGGKLPGGPGDKLPGGPGDEGFLSMYPPTTFVVMGPVAWLGWSLSKTVWVGVNVLLFGGAVFYLLRRTPLGTHTATACVFIALALAWAPIHANISQGQLGILAAVTGGVGLLMAERKKWFLPGVLVGISIAVKPQVGLLLLPGLALLRNWRALGFACGVIGLITVIGVLRLEATTPGWVDQLRANLDLFRNGQFGSATRSAPYRMQMLNLQYPLLQLVDAQRVIDPLVKGLTAVLAGVVAVSAWRRPTAGHTLLLCSALLSLMLMGVYHRVYDAAALLFPLAWALLPDQRTLKLRIWACAFLTAFLTPGGPMLTVVAQRGWIPAFVTGSVLWETVILPYQAWALFGLTVTLVVAWVTRHTPINSDNPSPMPA